MVIMLSDVIFTAISIVIIIILSIHLSIHPSSDSNIGMGMYRWHGHGCYHEQDDDIHHHPATSYRRCGKGNECPIVSNLISWSCDGCLSFRSIDLTTTSTITLS